MNHYVTQIKEHSNKLLYLLPRCIGSANIIYLKSVGASIKPPQVITTEMGGRVLRKPGQRATGHPMLNWLVSTVYFLSLCNLVHEGCFRKVAPTSHHFPISSLGKAPFSFRPSFSLMLPFTSSLPTFPNHCCTGTASPTNGHERSMHPPGILPFHRDHPLPLLSLLRKVSPDVLQDKRPVRVPDYLRTPPRVLLVPVTASLGRASVSTDRSLVCALFARPPAGSEGSGDPANSRSHSRWAQRLACGGLTFPLATALHLNLRLASARRRASCSSPAKVQCRFWLLLWYMLLPWRDARPTQQQRRVRRPRPRASVRARGPDPRRVRDVTVTCRRR